MDKPHRRFHAIFFYVRAVTHFSLLAGMAGVWGLQPTRVMSDAALGVAQSDALAASYSMHAASPLFSSDDWPISARRIWLHDSAICRPHK